MSSTLIEALAFPPAVVALAEAAGGAHITIRSDSANAVSRCSPSSTMLCGLGRLLTLLEMTVGCEISSVSISRAEKTLAGLLSRNDVPGFHRAAARAGFRMASEPVPVDWARLRAWPQLCDLF